MQDVRGEMRPVSCGSVAIASPMSPSEAVLLVRAWGMRTQCPDQRDLDGDGGRSGPRGCCRGIASGDLGARSVLVVPLAILRQAIQRRAMTAGHRLPKVQRFRVSDTPATNAPSGQ